MKYLLLIGIAVFIYWFTFRSRSRDSADTPDLKPKVEAMVRCAHCGMHLPKNEALSKGEEFFCSDQHLQLGSSPSK